MYCIALKDTREFKPNVKDYHLKNPLFLPVEMTFNDICKFWWWVLKLADHGILHIVVAHIWSVKDSTILVLCTRIPLCIYHDNVLQQVKWASLLNLTVFFITHIMYWGHYVFGYTKRLLNKYVSHATWKIQT